MRNLHGLDIFNVIFAILWGYIIYLFDKLTKLNISYSWYDIQRTKSFRRLYLVIKICIVINILRWFYEKIFLC